jgi:hypothetical protein
LGGADVGINVDHVTACKIAEQFDRKTSVTRMDGDLAPEHEQLR